jgi:hypothetical protein
MRGLQGSNRAIIARMTLDDFKATLSADRPPEMTPLLQALWHDAKGGWDRAHGIAQDVDDASGAWVHAYLHRKEGDLDNASYWYGRARQPVATDSLQDEWERIAGRLLELALIPNP